MPTPSLTEIKSFLSHFSRNLDATEVGVLYIEQFSDHYTDDEVDNQLLDADACRAFYMHQHGEWPNDDWQWWED